MRRRFVWLACTAALLLGCSPAIPAPSAEGTVVVSPSTRLFFRVYGDGPDTAIVLHGGPGLHHGYLVPALVGLLPGRTLIFYDQRGRGRSSLADTLALSPDSDVADLETLRRRFRLERMTLIGHHWGAAVAGLYAMRHPDHVSRILMLSPFIVHPSFAYDFALLGARGTDRAGAAAAYNALATPGDAVAFCRAYPWWSFLPTPADSPAVALASESGLCDLPGDRLRDGEAVKRAMLRSLGSWSWREGLSGVRAPVLIVEGHGPPIVESAARRWAEHLPNARLILLASPHLYPWVGDAAGFSRAADRFLRGGWPDGSLKPAPFATATRPDSASSAGRSGGTR
jgi:proline iminopeptidase